MRLGVGRASGARDPRRSGDVETGSDVGTGSLNLDTRGVLSRSVTRTVTGRLRSEP